MAGKPIPSFITNKSAAPPGKGSPTTEGKEAPPSNPSEKGAQPEKPEGEDTPSGTPGKTSMPLGKGAPPPDAKTPAPGKGGPQPAGKGALPEGSPPGPEPGPSPELQKAQELLAQYVQGLTSGTGLDPNALQATEQLVNMPETPDPTPGAMSNLVPKGTGGQRMGAIPSPGLPTGQMPLRVSPANPGVNLVGGLQKSMVEGMQMKMDGTDSQNTQAGKQQSEVKASESKNVKPGSKSIPPSIRK